MHDDILELSVLSAPRRARLRGHRYRIGPLPARSQRSSLTVGAGIRNGAMAGLFVVGALAVPFFLVLGARAPAPQLLDAPAVASARVWTETDAGTRIAEAQPADPVAAADGAARRSPLSVALIPVLDDASGDLAIAETAPTPPRRARPSTTAPARP